MSITLIKDMFKILLDGVRENKRGYDERLQRAAKSWDKYKTSQIETNPKHKKIKRVTKFLGLSYSLLAEIAQHLPYVHIIKLMESNPSVFMRLAQSNTFWTNKMVLEFGFGYPNDLTMPNNYYMDTLGTIFGISIDYEELVYVTREFRKTMYFLRQVKHFDSTRNIYGFRTGNTRLYPRGDLAMHDISVNSVRDFLRRIGAIGEQFRLMFNVGNEAFVVALIKGGFVNSFDYVFPYIERNPQNINYEILVEAAKFGWSHQIFEYTKSRFYVLDRKAFFLKCLDKNIYKFSINRLTRGYEFIRNDKDVMTKYFKTFDIIDFQYVGDVLKDNIDIINMILKKKKFYLFKYVGYSIKNYNKKIVLEFVKNMGGLLQHCGVRMIDDKDVVEAAVSNNWKAIQFASIRLRDNYKFMIKLANKYHIEVLKVSGTVLQREREFQDFIISNIRKYRLINVRDLKILINDSNFMWRLITKAVGRMGLRYIIGKKLKNDPNFMLKLINRFGNSGVIFIGDDLRNNPTIMLEAIKCNTWEVRNIGKDLSNNSDFMLKAMKITNYAVNRVGKNLRNDQDFILKALECRHIVTQSWFTSIKSIIGKELLKNDNFMGFLKKKYPNFFLM